MYMSNHILQYLNHQKFFVHKRSGSLIMYCKLLVNIVTIATLLRGAGGVELTFELPDNAKECFYEVIEEGKTSTVEFQV